jgi:uncharacterized membrane protein
MAEPNTNARLEAFCDGVFAIAATLLVIELRPPAPEGIATSADLWRELQHRVPAIAALILSFAVIVITWVNHHAMMKAVRGSSASFLYANALLLLTVVFIPFPTALLGEFLFSDHAAPAAVLYNAVLAVQGLAWALALRAIMKDQLTADERGLAMVRENYRNGFFGLALYSVLTITAFWFPLVAVTGTAVSWIFWLGLSIKLKHV